MTFNLLILLGSLLLMLGALASTLSRWLGVPLLLLFLGLGMLAGEDGLGGIDFDSFGSAFLISNLALAIILLDGGLRTDITSFRRALAPAGVLATFGVVITSGLLGVFATWLLGVDWRYGLLLGAIVGSTDAASVFNLLRNGGVTLHDRVGATLEVESGTNDPMAIFLVTLMMELLTAEEPLGALDMALRFVQQFGLGGLIGLAVGFGLVGLMRRARMAEGLYALLIFSGGLLAFAAATEVGGSGFLAVYLLGLLVGNARTRSAEPVLQVMDGMAWIAQAVLFLVLGLLVTPSHLLAGLLPALLLAGALIFIARPLAVCICLTPFKFAWREQLFIAWVGLRGAVPIVLAVFPVMAGLPDSLLLFDVTFVVVCVSLLVQGSTVATVARWLGVQRGEEAVPVETHKLWAGHDGSIKISAFVVEPHSTAAGGRLDRLGLLRDEALCVLIIRNNSRLLPEPDLRLRVGDVVWLLADDPHHIPPIFAAPTTDEPSGP